MDLPGEKIEVHVVQRQDAGKRLGDAFCLEKRLFCHALFRLISLQRWRRSYEWSSAYTVLYCKEVKGPGFLSKSHIINDQESRIDP